MNHSLNAEQVALRHGTTVQEASLLLHHESQLQEMVELYGATRDAQVIRGTFGDVKIFPSRHDMGLVPSLRPLRQCYNAVVLKVSIYKVAAFLGAVTKKDIQGVTEQLTAEQFQSFGAMPARTYCSTLPTLSQRVTMAEIYNEVSSRADMENSLVTDRVAAAIRMLQDVDIELGTRYTTDQYFYFFAGVPAKNNMEHDHIEAVLALKEYLSGTGEFGRGNQTGGPVEVALFTWLTEDAAAAGVEHLITLPDDFNAGKLYSKYNKQLTKINQGKRDGISANGRALAAKFRELCPRGLAEWFRKEMNAEYDEKLRLEALQRYLDAEDAKDDEVYLNNVLSIANENKFVPLQHVQGGRCGGIAMDVFDSTACAICRLLFIGHGHQDHYKTAFPASLFEFLRQDPQFKVLFPSLLLRVTSEPGVPSLFGVPALEPGHPYASSFVGLDNDVEYHLDSLFPGCNFAGVYCRLVHSTHTPLGSILMVLDAPGAAGTEPKAYVYVGDVGSDLRALQKVLEVLEGWFNARGLEPKNVTLSMDATASGAKANRRYQFLDREEATADILDSVMNHLLNLENGPEEVYVCFNTVAEGYKHVPALEVANILSTKIAVQPKFAPLYKAYKKHKVAGFVDECADRYAEFLTESEYCEAVRHGNDPHGDSRVRLVDRRAFSTVAEFRVFAASELERLPQGSRLICKQTSSWFRIHEEISFSIEGDRTAILSPTHFSDHIGAKGIAKWLNAFAELSIGPLNWRFHSTSKASQQEVRNAAQRFRTVPDP